MRRARRAVWLAHRYLGLTVGLYLAIVAATGSVLVFHTEIDARSRPAPVVALPSEESTRPLALAAIRGVLFARYGATVGARFTTFQFPRAPDHLYTTTGKVDGQTVTLTIDPQLGQIVQAVPTHSSPLVWAEDLHAHLLSGAAGFAANGWAALAAGVLLVSGVVVYGGALFPGSLTPRPPSQPVVPPSLGRGSDGNDKNANRQTTEHQLPLPREGGTTGWEGGRGVRDPGKRRGAWILRNSHSLLGLCTLILLLLDTLTGAALVFNDPVEHAIYHLTGTPPHPDPPLAATVPTTNSTMLDTLLDNARAAAPDAEVVFVTLPHRPGQAFYALLQKPSSVLPYVSVYVRPQTGAVLRVDRDDRAPLGRRIMGSVPALHEGTWGGYRSKSSMRRWGLPR